MSARARRSCRDESLSYAEEEDDLLPFLIDDNSSDDDEDVFSGDETDDDENVLLANVATAVASYDKVMGDPSWIGRCVKKVFGELGEFTGIVVGCNSGAEPGEKSLFDIYYFDDGDAEQMWPSEVHKHLVNANVQADKSVQQKYDALPGVKKSSWSAIGAHVAGTVDEAPNDQANPKSTKKKGINFVPLPQGRVVYFLMDCETTGK